MPLPEFTGGSLGLRRAAHLLRRAAFGGTKQQIDDFANLTAAAAVDRLYGATLPDPPLPIDPDTGTDWVSAPFDDSVNNINMENYFRGWFIGQMMSQGVDESLSLPYAARERIVYFLHTHFTTIMSRVRTAQALYFQNQLFRIFALDGATTTPDKDFKTLTVKLCVDNAMLRVLDGVLNVKGNVNENYAREFHELYTIGRGLEGSVPPVTGQGDYYYYTEAEVKAAALVFSGWDSDMTLETIDPDTLLPRGKVKGSTDNATQHNNETDKKKFRYGPPGTAIVPIIPDPTLTNGTNPTEESALDEIRQLVDAVYANPETPQNICRKIYRFFVWAPHTPEDMNPIDETIIKEMANTFIANNYKLQPVIENLLRSQHFYEAAGGAREVTDDNFGGIIKSPIDLVVGTYRFFDVQLPDMKTNPVDFYAATKDVLGILEDHGMMFYEPFDIAGYDAYYQYSTYHRAWITPNTLTERYNFIQRLFRAEQPGLVKVNPHEFIRNNFGDVAPSARDLMIKVVTYLLPNIDKLSFDLNTDQDDFTTLTAERLNYFLGRFVESTGNANPEVYWGTTWASYNEQELTPWLATFFDAILQTPEYQLG